MRVAFERSKGGLFYARLVPRRSWNAVISYPARALFLVSFASFFRGALRLDFKNELVIHVFYALFRRRWPPMAAVVGAAPRLRRIRPPLGRVARWGGRARHHAAPPARGLHRTPHWQRAPVRARAHQARPRSRGSSRRH